MAGLIDSNTGLDFGTGLQFQTEIGTGSLIIGPGGTTQEELFWGSDELVWDVLVLIWGS